MLRPRKRITKKEIKEDPLVTNYLKVQNWLKKHSKQINIAIGGIIVVLLIVLMAVRSKRQAEIKAESQLSVVEQFYYQMDYNKVVQQMPEIIDKYRGTRAAGEAAFFVANSYYNLKDYAGFHVTIQPSTKLTGCCSKAVLRRGMTFLFCLRAVEI